jgi:hypothetical protein
MNKINKDFIYNLKDITISDFIKNIKYNIDIENILNIIKIKELNNFK